MINPTYFAWMTCAGGQEYFEASVFRRLLAEGKISAALTEATQNAVRSNIGKSMVSFWVRSALDVALLIDCVDEVFEEFQRYLLAEEGEDLAFNVLHLAAVKAIAKGDVVAVIRNYAGMTQVQFDASKRCEGLAGMAFAFISLADLETTAILAERLIFTAPKNSGWAGLGRLIQADIRGMREWHLQTFFRDHVYWHQSFQEFRAEANEEGDFSSHPQNDIEIIFSQLRTKQLGLRAMSSTPLQIQHLHRQYEWGVRELSKTHLTSVKIELAMVVISHNCLHLLTQLLAGIDSESMLTSPVYSAAQRLELCYCFYKLYRSQGHGDKAKEFYRNYLILSANRTRLSADVGHYCDDHKTQRSRVGSDDVSARLPARYRRAYQYMLNHLDQNDLSVQDIANAIDVTARALQQVFKKYLGESPTEVLRRRRIERVHSALLNVSNSTLIMDVAKKYGINCRTTLTSEYRKIYAELPSRTLRMGSIYMSS